jgi:hypothetical protein
MEDFFRVLQRSFTYLQVLQKKKIKAGEEMFCDYLGDLWFQMETTDSIIVHDIQAASTPPTAILPTVMVREDGLSAATPCGICGEPASPNFSYVFLHFFSISHFHVQKGGGV